MHALISMTCKQIEVQLTWVLDKDSNTAPDCGMPLSRPKKKDNKQESARQRKKRDIACFDTHIPVADGVEWAAQCCMQAR